MLHNNGNLKSSILSFWLRILSFFTKAILVQIWGNHPIVEDSTQNCFTRDEEDVPEEIRNEKDRKELYLRVAHLSFVVIDGIIQ